MNAYLNHQLAFSCLSFSFLNRILSLKSCRSSIRVFLYHFPLKMSTPYDLPKDASAIKPFEWNERYDFPRDLVGYGENSFNPQWPNGAKIAVSFVINYEEVPCVSLFILLTILTSK